MFLFFLIIWNKNIPRPCFMPVCFVVFCCNAPDQFTSLLNLHHVIFSLTPFGWFIYIYLSLFFFWKNVFFFICALCIPTFSGTQLGHETGPWCTVMWNCQGDLTTRCIIVIFCIIVCMLQNPFVFKEYCFDLGIRYSVWVCLDLFLYSACRILVNLSYWLYQELNRT
jgi:hypothetical protein